MMFLMNLQTVASLIGVLAVVLVLWGHFRSLERINKNLEHIKNILREKNSK